MGLLNQDIGKSGSGRDKNESLSERMAVAPTATYIGLLVVEIWSEKSNSLSDLLLSEGSHTLSTHMEWEVALKSPPNNSTQLSFQSVTHSSQSKS